MPVVDRVAMERRDVTIMRLVNAGQSPRMIQRALIAAGFDKISEHRIRKIIRRELEKVKEIRLGFGEMAFEQQIQQLDLVIESMHSVLTTACRRCSGKGHMGQDPDKGEGTMLVCDMCKGDTKMFSPERRVQSSREFRQALDQKAKLLGLYAPEKFAFTNPDGSELDFAADYAGMSIDDLNKEFSAINDAMEASDNERKAKEHETL